MKMVTRTMARLLAWTCASASLWLSASCSQELTATPHDPVRIVFSGFMQGHLEPCGCASAQSGGVDRRAWWLKINKQLYDLKLEGGNLIKENNPLERFKLMWIQNLLGAVMDYKVFPLGPRDLSIGAEELSLFHDEKGAPFLVSDLRKVTDDGETAPYLTHSIQKAGEHKVCVLSLAGPDGLPAKTGYRVLQPADAVRRALSKAGQRGKDYDLCIAFVNYGDPDNARVHAKTLPGVDLVASFAPHEETFAKPEVFERDKEKAGVERTTLLRPGWKGKNLLLWTGVRENANSWKTQDVKKVILAVPKTPKGKRPAGSDPEIWDLLIQSKRDIGAEGLLEKMASRFPTKNGAKYAGSESCKGCHADAYEIWSDTTHKTGSWDSLVDREKNDGWPVTKHPDCVSCHVVGYGYKSGFVSMTKTPTLNNVGCEACHGPGSAHNEAMAPVQKYLDAGKTPPKDVLEKARKDGLLGKVGHKSCIGCHDFEQSPGFDFQERWEAIEHK